jgi:LCP family protein required for cell wall assembly
MQNFKKPNKRPNGLAVDGIVRPTRSPKTNLSEGKIHRVRSYRPEVAPIRARKSSVGDFRQPETRRITDGSIPLGERGARPLLNEENQNQPKLGESVKQQQSSGKEKKSRKWWPFKRKNKDKQPLTKKQKIKRGVLIFAGLAVLMGLLFAGFTWWNARKVLPGGGGAPALQDCEDLSQLKKEGDCRVNILLLGRGGGTHEAPDLTDTIIVASIDPVQNEAVLLSVPRDLYVKSRDGYSYSKINAVFANARNAARGEGKNNKDSDLKGLAAIEGTLEDVLDIPIHYNAMVDFEGFRQAIETVGGVTINVKEELYDPTVAWENNWDPYIAKVGVQEFNGQRALLYARSRQTSPRGDFDRSARQREVLVALKDKIFTAGTYGNPVKVTQLLDTFGDHVKTNFSIDEIMKLYAIGSKTQSTNIKSVGLSDPPNDYLTTDMYGGQSVVVPTAGLDNYDDIRAFLRRTLIDPRIKQEQPVVAVINGTSTAGLSTDKTALLKSYGYKMKEASDAPTKDYEQTVLVDLRGGDKKFSTHYLQRRFKTTATDKLPAGITVGEDVDFVIILGRNETSTN